MEITKKMLGGINILLAILVTYHWYVVHYTNGNNPIELIIAIVVLFIIGLACLMNKIKVKDK